MGLNNQLKSVSSQTTFIETDYRRIATTLPCPQDVERIVSCVGAVPDVNGYQTAVIWERAYGATIEDIAGNRWIDFTSTAVMANTGHGDERIREAVSSYAQSGLLAQFSFNSRIRFELIERLLEITPPHLDSVYLWTTGSETVESCYRAMMEAYLQRKGTKNGVVLSVVGDYHGCTLGAHELSGVSSRKEWRADSSVQIDRLPFPKDEDRTDKQWREYLLTALAERGIDRESIGGVLLETFQGWGARMLPVGYVHAIRWLATDCGFPLAFDEVQTGFGRTGRLFGHEHYDVDADMICLGKGLSSTLPIAALVGRREFVDTLPPGEVTTTHAGHPLSCAAALANLDVLIEQELVARAARLGVICDAKLGELAADFAGCVTRVSGAGLLWAIHFQENIKGISGHEFARQVVNQSVLRGVMLFHVNKHTVKICPPLVIEENALREGIQVIRDVIQNLVQSL